MKKQNKGIKSVKIALQGLSPEIRLINYMVALFKKVK